jgi:hypothetical protein
MKAHRIQSMFVAVALTALVLGPITPANAGAIIDRESSSQTETFQAPLEFCLPQDLIGQVTITETSTSQSVQAVSGVFTIRFVNEYNYRIVFPDDRYVQSGINRDLAVFVASPSHSVLNLVTQDFRTIYAADGTPVGRLSVHAVFHVTFNDLNGNSQVDEGELKAAIDKFDLRCT